MLQIRTLGELRQADDAGPARSLRRKPLALVAYLARRARPVPRTELATLFWGERGEERARQSLRQALLELKQALGGAVDIDAESVRLAAGAVTLDLTAFEQDVAAGRVQEAIERWTGDFLQGAEDIGGDGFRRWIESERAGLHRQLGVALEKLIGDAELRGDWAAAAGWAERWATALPFDEHAHLRLIEALRMTGRSGEALQAHSAFVSRVRSALDLEPSAEFLRLGGDLAGDARSELARRGRTSAAVHPPELMGRGAVLSELLDAWQVASSGGAVACLIRGEGGSGRTTMCELIAEQARASGIVLRAQGTGGEDWSTTAALFEGLPQAPGLAGAAPEALAELVRLVPALSSRFRNLPPPAPSATETALRDAAAAVLAAIGEEKPVLVVVDDVQAADGPSARLLTALAARLPSRVMLLLAEDETHVRAGLLADAPGFRRVTLGRLTVAEVETMLGSMVTLEPGDRHELAGRLFEESAGLPVAVLALVQALVDERLLAPPPDSSGSWRVSPTLAGRPLPIPLIARERVRKRLESLPPSYRALLEALMVLGEPADAALVAAVAELSPDEAEAAFTALAARRVIRDDGGTPPRYMANIPLAGRTVLALIPPTRRQALHARAAEVLAARDLASTAERSLLPYHLARAEAPAVAAPARRRRPAPMLIAAGAAVVLGGSALAWALFHKHSSLDAATTSAHVPVVALGRIADYRENTANQLTRPLTDMLATNLGRVRHVRVVSTARMYELMSQRDPSGRDTSSAALVAAARRAGATELVDGALYSRGEGGFRLDLRRVELASGSIRQTHSVSGATVFELADSGTARLAADFGEASPAGSIADVTTRSITAYQLYEQGLRAYHAADLRAAQPLFEAALAEDSSFAMAAYYSALTATEDSRRVLGRLGLAARLAAKTSDRERLIILAGTAFLSSSPAQRALADTLVTRYPEEVQGHFFTGLSLMVDGEFLAALPALNRVVAMDSLALSGNRARCDACDALRQLVSIYQLADSLPAAEREARRWVRLQPTSPSAWYVLADVLSQQGHGDAALAVLDSAARYDAGRREGERLTVRAVHRIYAGDFAQADLLLSGEVASGSTYRINQALWYRALSYRYQGRLSEALADARRYRAMALQSTPASVAKARRAAPPDALPEAQILFEMGRYRESAALFDSVSRWMVGDESPSQLTHARVWALTHAAGARAAAGDTTGLLARADTLELLGPESALGRDHLLHHYVRGLVLAARGDHAAAIAAFRAANWSSSFGYTRINVALAQSLLKLGRPREAVPVLQSALHGSVEASNFYVTRVALHHLLAQAWDAVGGTAGRDSAALHRALAARAWSRADSSFLARQRQEGGGI